MTQREGYVILDRRAKAVGVVSDAPAMAADGEGSLDLTHFPVGAVILVSE